MVIYFLEVVYEGQVIYGEKMILLYIVGFCINFRVNFLDIWFLVVIIIGLFLV